MHMASSLCYSPTGPEKWGGGRNHRNLVCHGLNAELPRVPDNADLIFNHLCLSSIPWLFLPAVLPWTVCFGLQHWKSVIGLIPQTIGIVESPHLGQQQGFHPG